MFTDIVIDKDKSVRLFETGLLLRSNQIFKYQNLPESLNENRLEYMLQKKGEVYIIKHENDFIICDNYSESGNKNYYGESDEITVVNPYCSEISKKYHIYSGLNHKNTTDDKSSTYDFKPESYCIQFKNNYLKTSVLELLSKYCTLIVESEITLRSYIINSRNMFTILAGDNKSKQNCEQFLKKLEKGDLSVLLDNTFLESIKVLNNSVSGDFIYKLMQTIQYLKASCLHEIGINANYEIKRTVTSQADIDLNLDYLIPLIDNMLQSRIESVNNFNKCFNTEVKVMLHSTWLNERLKSESLIHSESVPEESEISIDSPEASESSENEKIDSDSENSDESKKNEIITE